MKIRKLSVLIVIIVIGLMLLAQVLSFISFKIWGNRQTDILFENIVSDITDNINSEIEVIENVAFNISVDKTVQNNIFHFNIREKARDVQNFQNAFSKYLLNTKSICYVGVVAENELMCYNTLKDIDNESFYRLWDKTVSNYILPQGNNTSIQNLIYRDKVYFVCLSNIFPLDVVNTKQEIDSYVVIFFDPVDLLIGSKNIDKTKTQIVITDKDDVVLASNSNLKTGEKYVFDTNSKLITKTAELNKISCRLHVTVPIYEVLDMTEPSNIILILIVVFNILLFVFLMMTLMKTILKPILNIEKGANIIMNGNYEYRFANQGENEISNIAIAMNGILDAVKKSHDEKLLITQKLFEATLLQKQAEISHMQNQISPHFLYNSMEQINNIAKHNNVPEIVGITNIMADTFRYNTDGTELTTVGRDIDYAFNYFNIINLRRSTPLNVTYDVSDEVQKCKCLKMIFQPILENTIKHAFKNNMDGSVEIKGQFIGDYAVIEFKDNGIGIDEKKLEEITDMLSGQWIDEGENESGIGIFNVHRRLRIYYDDEKCGISIKSKEKEGSIVKITIRKTL